VLLALGPRVDGLEELPEPRFAATSTRFHQARVVQTTACSRDVSPRVSVSVIKPAPKRRAAARTGAR